MTRAKMTLTQDGGAWQSPASIFDDLQAYSNEVTFCYN
jgi:hypothetical protein